MAKHLFNILIVVFAVFVTYIITKMVYTKRALETFTTNFNPDDQGMEQSMRGYAYQFGDKTSDMGIYFGFPDDLATSFAKRLLPDIIPQERPKN